MPVFTMRYHDRKGQPSAGSVLIDTRLRAKCISCAHYSPQCDGHTSRQSGPAAHLIKLNIEVFQQNFVHFSSVNVCGSQKVAGSHMLNDPTNFPPGAITGGFHRILRAACRRGR
jgi:hypothetical protein